MTLSASSLNKRKNKYTNVSVNTAEKLVNLVRFGDGGDFEVITGIKVEARDLMACLYGQKKVDSLDVLCEHVFANTKGDMRNLSPTEDCSTSIYCISSTSSVYANRLQIPT